MLRLIVYFIEYTFPTFLCVFLSNDFCVLNYPITII